MKKQKRGNRGQIAIFVIIALILVVSIAGIFMLLQSPLMKTGAVDDPRVFISQCAEEAGAEALELIGTHGGYLEAPDLNMRYENEEIAYLCYTSEEKELCTSQEGRLISRIEEEVENYVTPKIQLCFQNLEKSLARYNPELGEMNLEVKIIPNSVLIQIDRSLSFIRTEQSQTYEKFDASISSPMFDFARMTIEIINDELDCECGEEVCNANIIDMASKNRGFDFEKFVTGRNEEVYRLREFSSDKEFTFAIRNCVRFW